jgi:TonB family protein
MRRVCALFALIVACPIGHATAAPMPPSGKWEVEYTATSCQAKRRFGDISIGIEPAPLGQTVNLIVVGPGQADRFARQYSTMIDPGDGGGPFRTTSLVAPSKAKGRRAMMTVLSPAEAQRIERGTRLRIGTTRALTRLRTPTRTPTPQSQMSADVALAYSPALSRAMAACSDDLRKHWGMVDGQLAKPAVRAEGDLRSLFSDDDYPADALEAENTGTTRFLIMVDEQGLPMDCVVIESSGVASLDAMGCQVIRDRLKFKPARDANGKPVKDTFTSPPIRWSISSARGGSRIP